MLAYDRLVRHSVVIGFLLLAACPGPEPTSRIPKKPNDELIVGEFERHPPAGTTAYRFGLDGTFIAAKAKGELDRTPHLSEGTYKVGSYKVVISKVGIRFVEKIEDACDWRGRLAGQTLWRIK